MKRSTDRILTTHAGSLPRPDDFPRRRSRRWTRESAPDPTTFASRVPSAIDDGVRRQVDAGIDVVSDGEQGKAGYSTYVRDRLTGFEGKNRSRSARTGRTSRGGRASRPLTVSRPACPARSPGKTSTRSSGHRQLQGRARQRAAARRLHDRGLPGVIALFLDNEYYPTRDAYLTRLADVMQDEYEAIASAGLRAAARLPRPGDEPPHARSADLTTAGFPQDRAGHTSRRSTRRRRTSRRSAMRLHLCWGNYEGPHHLDIPLKDIIDIVLKARPPASRFEGANPRHEHEWDVWQDVKLPDGKVIIPGVIDSHDELHRAPRAGRPAHRALRRAASAGERHRRHGLRLRHVRAVRHGRPRASPGRSSSAMADGARLASGALAVAGVIAYGLEADERRGSTISHHATAILCCRPLDRSDRHDGTDRAGAGDGSLRQARRADAGSCSPRPRQPDERHRGHPWSRAWTEVGRSLPRPEQDHS